MTATPGTFAVVVRPVREAEAQIVDLSTIPHIGHGVLNDPGPDSGGSVAEVGVQRDSPPERSATVHLRERLPGLCGNLCGVLVPPQAGDAVRLARPAVAHGVVEQPALLDLDPEALNQPAGLGHGEAGGALTLGAALQGIAAM